MKDNKKSVIFPAGYRKSAPIPGRHDASALYPGMDRSADALKNAFEAAGLNTHFDAVGNLFGRRAANTPTR